MSSDAKATGTVTGAIRQGRFLTWGGPMPLVISSDLLAGLYAGIAARDDEPLDALRNIGQEWGQRWFERVRQRATQLGASVTELALEDIQHLLHDDMTRSGWGRPTFDLDTFADAGIIQITVVGGPAAILESPEADGAAVLQAGFFAGVFSALTDLPMSGFGVRAEAATIAGSVIALAQPVQIDRLRLRLERGDGWLDALSGARVEERRAHRRSTRAPRVRERR